MLICCIYSKYNTQFCWFIQNKLFNDSLMLAVNKPEQQLRKSIYSQINNSEQKKFILDRIGDKIGYQNVAYILMTFSSAVFPLGFLYTNENNFNVCQTFLIRAIAVVSMNFVIARYFHISIQYQEADNFKILFIRNFLITLQSIIFTVAQFYLSQSIIQTITTTGPLFIFILDYKINHVTITRKQFYGVILGVVGVLLTVNGQLIIKSIDSTYESKSDFKNYASDDPMVKFVVASIFVLANILWAYAQVITKGLNGVNSIQINIHLGLFFLFTTGMFYPAQVQNPVTIQKFISAIFFGGVVMTIGQITFIGATTMTKNTGVLTMFVFVGVIEGYLVSVFKYNQTINPICIAGAMFIIFGLAKIVFKNNSDQRSAQGPQK